jgi:PAS domain S-box-containing protein
LRPREPDSPHDEHAQARAGTGFAALPPGAVAPLILENVRDAVFATDLSNRITFWAPSAERLFGIGASEAHGRPFGELLPFDIAASSDEADLLTSLAGGRAWRGEGSVRLRDGTELWIESTVSPLEVDGRVVGGVSVSRDMTAHRAETRRRESAERALRALSTLNRELVRTSDEVTLLGEACRIAVDMAGYRFAWVAYADDDAERTIRPVAWAGSDGGYLRSLRITWADEPRGRGPVGTAIRTGRTDTMRDPGDPRVDPWRDELGQAGFLSFAALPLSSDERTFGALVVYAAEPDSFSPAELDLLVEMAGDLAYGIVARRTQAAHDRAVDAMRRSEERYRTVVDALAEGVVVQDADGAIVAANPAARAILGWRTRSASLPARWPVDVIREDGTPFAPRDHPAAVTLRTGRAKRNVLMGLRRPSGEVRWIAIHTDPLRDGDGSPSVVSSFEDVTHYRTARAEQLFEARLRAALSEAVQGIPADASLARSAQTITDQVATLPGIDLVGVGAFLGEDELVVLASHAPPGATSRTGFTLPEAAARHLRSRTAEGPWAQYVRDLPDTGAWSADLAQLGIVGIAVGPIAHGDHVDGVLLIGSREREPARILVEKMPAVVAFSATSSALLARRLHAHREEVARRRHIEQLLADGAFHPVFQPIVDLVSREAVGYEALTRFESGQRPDLCFRDAWLAGLGPDLEVATLRAAVHAAAGLPAGRWLDLNLSPRLLLEPDRVAELLRGAGRPLVLEVTEHEQVDDYGALHEAVRRLGQDIRVAVDDAGAGAANFGHIVEMRPDFVKLDISLVRHVNNDLGRQALVVAMRQFARSSGCRLVGEGVETELEASTLTELGVEFGQGYLFGRPEPLPG